MLCCTQSSFPKILEIPENWKAAIKSDRPILPYKLARIMNVTEDQEFPQATDKAITETTAYFAYLRKAALESNLFDLASNKTLDLFYSIESYELDRASKILDNVEKLRVRYQVKTSDGKILFDQVVESVGVYDFASNKESKSWRANTQKFLVLLRTRWDNNFLFTGEKLWQAAEIDALNPNRTVSSSILTGAGATVLAVGSVVVAGGEVVKGTLSTAGDVLSDPAFSTAVSQMNQDMTRQLEKQRRQEIEAKAYSARMAAESRQASTASSSSTSYSLASSSKSSLSGSSSSSKSSGTSSSSSSGGNTNIGAINKKYQTEREKNLKVQEQKKLEQQKTYDAKLAKEQQERDEQERVREKQLAEQEKQRQIQLANEKREREQQAEKERKERELLAKKQQEEQEKNNYLTSVKNGLRLKAVSCYGNNYPLGQMPKGLAFSKHVSGINVHYRAYCSGGGRYNGISRNFIGMGDGCFTGDTTGNEIPKSVLSCSTEEMTVEVTNVTPTR